MGLAFSAKRPAQVGRVKIVGTTKAGDLIVVQTVQSVIGSVEIVSVQKVHR